jgi:inosine-uridine nucleoside N-ribohydrolase
MDALIPTVIDTDPGIDDALALLLAWGSPELDVLALTVVAGNAPLADTARNTARLVAARQPARLPQIALGAAAPLRRALVTSMPDEHGSDGLGDAVDWPPVTGPPASPSAAETLVALARAHGERLALIALGPLTNLALALRLDADAMRRIGRVVMMGGAVDVPGNSTPDSELPSTRAWRAGSRRGSR